jgi:hypothetical protein
VLSVCLVAGKVGVKMKAYNYAMVEIYKSY